MPVTINGSAGVTTNSGAVYNGLQTDTAKSATGTSVDFTGIPSWVKRVTVMFSGVSTSGTSGILLQLGDAGGIENTGYAGAGSSVDSSAVVTTNFTAGIGVTRNFVAANTLNGSLTITNVTSNTWAISGLSALNSTVQYFASGVKTLSDVLTQVRITTVNGTDTFDAGTINIIYE